MLRFTLDSNGIIALDEGREPAASAVMELAAAHSRGAADVAVVGISASERPKQGEQPITNFDRFRERLCRLGLGDLEILRPLHYWEVTFLDWWIWGDAPMYDLERRIHQELFPTSYYSWSDHCAAKGLSVDQTPLHSDPWLNRKCDVLALWSHVHAQRDVFVTSDRRFHERKSALIALGAGRIENAVGAAALLPRPGP